MTKIGRKRRGPENIKKRITSLMEDPLSITIPNCSINIIHQWRVCGLGWVHSFLSYNTRNGGGRSLPKRGGALDPLVCSRKCLLTHTHKAQSTHTHIQTQVGSEWVFKSTTVQIYKNKRYNLVGIFLRFFHE